MMKARIEMSNGISDFEPIENPDTGSAEIEVADNGVDIGDQFIAAVETVQVNVGDIFRIRAVDDEDCRPDEGGDRAYQAGYAYASGYHD